LKRTTICAVTAALGLLLATATAAVAKPFICIGVPAQGATVNGAFFIGGWALDLASSRDSGVSEIHAWAYPASGGAPIFAGTMTRASRPDVAAIFGSQFANSGFNISVTLPPGSYVLALTPWSSLTNSFAFDAMALWPITVAAPPPPSSSSQLRVLQWNTHHGGYGTDGVYSPDRIATWAATFNPDVVMFNEIEKYTSWGNQNQPEVYKTLLQQKTGRTWYYVFAQEFGAWSSNGKGNLILSRYPISISDRYELVHNADRSIAMGVITVGGREITLISTHLDPYDQSLRLTQAREVTGWSAVQPENRIVTGDMNAWPDQTSIAHFNTLYNDSWTVAAAAGKATAFSGNNGETKNGRIDYIFYSKNATNLTVVSSQVYDTRDASGTMPSDHRPVLTTFAIR
jgi:endonuclease/exonuclease/phosphatase family metal-dependent hydrolase